MCKSNRDHHDTSRVIFWSKRDGSMRNRGERWREEGTEMNQKRQGKKKRRYLGGVMSSGRLTTAMEGDLQLILWTV